MHFAFLVMILFLTMQNKKSFGVVYFLFVPLVDLSDGSLFVFF